MLFPRVVLLVVVCMYPYLGYSQEIFNPVAPREKGKDIVEYIQTVEKRLSKKNSRNRLSNVNSSVYKELFARLCFSRLNNPQEFFRLFRDENRRPLMNEFTHVRGVVQELFLSKELYQDFDFPFQKYHLRDLYWAPFVLLGTIAKIDTLCSRPVVIKYQISDIEMINKYYAPDVRNRKIEFLFSTFHRGLGAKSWLVDPGKASIYEDTDVWSYRKSHDLTLNSRYLLFLMPTFGTSECSTKHGLDNLLYLHITTLGDECFPVVRSSLIDNNRYWGPEEEISLDEVKAMIHSILDEISSWRSQ